MRQYTRVEERNGDVIQDTSDEARNEPLNDLWGNE